MRQKFVTLYSQGCRVMKICRRFREEGTIISHQALYNLLRKHQNKGTVVDLSRRKREKKITEEMKALIEEELRKNDELTSSGIKRLLTERWPNLQVSIPTIK